MRDIVAPQVTKLCIRRNALRLFRPTLALLLAALAAVLAAGGGTGE